MRRVWPRVQCAATTSVRRLPRTKPNRWAAEILCCCAPQVARLRGGAGALPAGRSAAARGAAGGRADLTWRDDTLRCSGTACELGLSGRAAGRGRHVLQGRRGGHIRLPSARCGLAASRATSRSAETSAFGLLIRQGGRVCLWRVHTSADEHPPRSLGVNEGPRLDQEEETGVRTSDSGQFNSEQWTDI